MRGGGRPGVAVYFASNQLAVDVKGLVSWLHRNYAALPHGEASATARLSNLLPLLRREAELPGAPVEQRPDFWPTLHSLIALGWIGTAIELLGFHSVWARERVRGQREELASAEVELLSALMALLRTLPRFLPTGSPNQDSLVGRLFTDSAAPFLRFREVLAQPCGILLPSVLMRCFALVSHSCGEVNASS